MITLIAAIDRRRAIGFENKLLFKLPNDLKRFKQLTTAHTVLMGRKTFESLPKGALPHRRNIVLSSNRRMQYPGAELFTSLAEALRSCPPHEEIYIIGGESLYQQTLPLANTLCLTEIDAESPQADAWFPAIDPAEWVELVREPHPADERHAHPYSFVDYTRRNGRISAGLCKA
ncbi:MAG: dihydrofolate reductase [Prevotellaceae bacterium]|jgi:dihydrofolate reductase|nr:dihydrofolate reductase [Prevotellaceae bacterium]